MDYYTIIHICRMDMWHTVPLLSIINKAFLRMLHEKDILLEWMEYHFNEYDEPNTKWLHQKLPIFDATPLELYKIYSGLTVVFVENQEEHSRLVFDFLHGVRIHKKDPIIDLGNRYVITYQENPLVRDRYEELIKFANNIPTDIFNKFVNYIEEFILGTLLVEFEAIMTYCGTKEQVKFFEYCFKSSEYISKLFIKRTILIKDINGKPCILTLRREKNQLVAQYVTKSYDISIASLYVSGEDYINNQDKLPLMQENVEMKTEIKDPIYIEYHVEEYIILRNKIPRDQLSLLTNKFKMRLDLINCILNQINFNADYRIVE